MKRVELSLKDLTTNFKKHTVTSTLQCTGNRRDMFNDVKKVKGLEWGVGKWLRMSIVSSSTVHFCFALRDVHAARCGCLFRCHRDGRVCRRETLRCPRLCWPGR